MKNTALAELKHHIRMFEVLGDALESLLNDILRTTDDENEYAYNIDTTYDDGVYNYTFFLGGDMEDWNCQILPGLKLTVEQHSREPVHILVFNMCVKDAKGDFIGADIKYSSDVWTLSADEYAYRQDAHRPHPPIYTELLRLLSLQPGEKRELSRKEAFINMRRFIDLCHRAMRRELPWVEESEAII